MRKIVLILGATSLGLACEKTELPAPICQFPLIDSTVSASAGTLIPLHSDNYWTYIDSSFQNGVFQSVTNTAITIDKVYDLDGMLAFNFSSLIPLMTVRNDTLFSTGLNLSQSPPNCYELFFPMFFSTQDSLQVDNDPSNKYVYRRRTPVNTPKGIFGETVVYREEQAFEIISHEAVGMIKISFFVQGSGGQMEKRRTLTIDDFMLN